MLNQRPALTGLKRHQYFREFHVTYLQVSGDGMVGSMGDQEDAIGLADQPVTLLNLPCMPVNDTCPHDG